MPGKKEPEGSTANLPPMEVIDAAEASRETDIDALFGAGSEEDDSSPEGAGASPAPSSDADAGAGGDEGSSPAPVTDKPPVEGAAPGQPATPGDGTPSAPSAQPQTPTPAAGTPPVAPADNDKLRIGSLEATVEALQAELARARANPPAAGQQPSTQPGGGSAQPDDLPRYALNLPPQVLAALTSEDEGTFAAGITNVMNSLATIVHHNVRLEMRQAFGNLIASAREQDTQTATATAIETARADYYKAFPAHKDPLILPIIQAETAAMAAQFPGMGWNDDYRNALGQRVDARLAQLRGQVQNGNGSGAPPAQPAPSIPGGPRPDAVGGELTGGDLIADTFGRL